MEHSKRFGCRRRSTQIITGKLFTSILTIGCRGFGFVEFVSSEEAKQAFSALQHSHLYGRKLIIEWAKMEEGLGAEADKRQKTEN